LSKKVWKILPVRRWSSGYLHPFCNTENSLRLAGWFPGIDWHEHGLCNSRAAAARTCIPLFNHVSIGQERQKING